MRKALLFLTLLFVCQASLYAQTTQFWVDNFEDAGSPSSGTRIPETNGGNALSYFKRTDGTDITYFFAGTLPPYSGWSGAKFWAGKDYDLASGLNMNQELQIEWTGINIAGKSGLSFTGAFAAQNDIQTSPWESTDYIIVEYAIDAGAYQNLVAFQTNGGTDKKLALDTDFNGVGDGTLLSKVFQDFSKSISGTGTTLKLRIRTFTNDAAEEFAWDNFRLTETQSCVQPTVTVQPVNRTVCAGRDTTFTVTATGATAYLWQVNTGSGFNDLTNTAPYSGVTSNTLRITGATAGMNNYTYRCKVMNGATTCFTNTNAVTLNVSSISTTAAAQTDLLCNGVCTGSATVAASGGIGTYTYSWSPFGGTAATASSLCAATYTVTVNDGIGCQATRNFTITQPNAFSVTPSQTNLLCGGASTGSASVAVSGATPGYTYTWTPSVSSGPTASNLAAGAYSVLIRDANSCTATRNFTITGPAALSTTGSKTDVSCNGGSNGMATVTTTGGTGAYTYSWNPAAGNGPTASGLSAGSYTVTVKDANLCETTRNFTISEPVAISLTAAPDAGICAGANTTIFSLALGGTGTLNYVWQPGALNGPTHQVSPDTTTRYVVTVTDGNSCFKRDTVIVNVAANIAQASAGTGAPLAGTSNNNSNNTQSGGGLQSLYAGNCAIIASVQDNAGLGTVTASVTATTTVPVYSGRPYVGRVYEITPTNNVPAQVVLYYTQADFDLYNTYAQNNGFPRLPQNPTDQAGIDSLRITKTSGGPLSTGSGMLIDPTSVAWDATMQYWKITLQAPSFSYFYVHANNANNTPLPVDLRSFTAAKEHDAAILRWTTGKERNNKGFVIERSADGKQFLAIGEIASKAAQGTSDQELAYQFTDKAPYAGLNYYRLVQLDLDGRSVYSGVRVLDFGNRASDWTVYPNPAQDVVQVLHEATTDTRVSVVLTDVAGRVVLHQDWTVTRGAFQQALPLKGLPAGMYQLLISDNGHLVHRAKVVKK